MFKSVRKGDWVWIAYIALQVIQFILEKTGVLPAGGH